MTVEMDASMGPIRRWWRRRPRWKDYRDADDPFDAAFLTKCVTDQARDAIMRANIPDDEISAYIDGVPIRMKELREMISDDRIKVRLG